MSDLVKKNGSTPWGEDPHFSLSVARDSKNSELLVKSIESVRRQYRLRIRQEIEKNKDAVKLISHANPAISIFTELTQLLKYISRNESSDIFDEVVNEILAEIDALRQKPGSIYLVDTDTGKTGIAISAEHIYHPPDFVGEDGKIKKSSPILHPGISAPIIQDRFEKARLSEALIRAPKSASLALEHLRDPEKILSWASEILETHGIIVGEVLSPQKSIKIEFGREQSDGALQSLNPRFHRAQMYGRILANKVMIELNGKKSCSLGQILQKNNSKQRWYEIWLYST